MAGQLALDVDAFTACMDASETEALVQADREFAQERGIESTPSFLVGDTIVVGNDIASLREALDSALAGADTG
jgi:protein-disulfide isomerase